MGAKSGRGPEDRFVPGDWNIECSMCGQKLKAGDAVRNWQGMWRHVRCNEPRHPQDFVHALDMKEMAVPFVQKTGDIDVQICTLNSRSAIPGYAIPGCAIPGRTFIEPTEDSPTAMTGLLTTEDGQYLVTENGLVPIHI